MSAAPDTPQRSARRPSRHHRPANIAYVVEGISSVFMACKDSSLPATELVCMQQGGHIVDVADAGVVSASIKDARVLRSLRYDAVAGRLAIVCSSAP